MLTTCDDQRKGESKTGSNVRHSRHAGDRDRDERKAQEIESTRPIGDDLVGSPRGVERCQVRILVCGTLTNGHNDQRKSFSYSLTQRHRLS